ncbi:MAG: hypothetical protein PUD80_08885 [Firmicutes bacterium]|nr:hypothetical protein [Bacillota bacterium]
MNCLKCGREIEEGQVFCGDCLLDMEKHPVKPGTAVQLPPQVYASAPKKAHPRRRTKPAPEEQVKSLKLRVRVLAVLLAICIVLLAVLTVPAMKYYREDHFLPGQNYSAVSSTEEAGGN